MRAHIYVLSYHSKELRGTWLATVLRSYISTLGGQEFMEIANLGYVHSEFTLAWTTDNTRNRRQQFL